MTRFLTLSTALLVAACSASHQEPPQPADLASPEQAFFKHYQQLSNSFDEALVSLYADDALISTDRVLPDGTQKSLTLTGAKYKPMALQMLPIAKMRDDRSLYTDVAFNKVDDTIKITATRYSTLKCYTDPSYFMVLGNNASGALEISAEHSQTQSLSSCPDEDPTPLIATIAKIYEGKLPIMADADSRLDNVVPNRSELNFHFTLVNISKNTIDAAALHTAIRAGMIPQACLRPEFRNLLDNGASISYRYNDKNNDSLVDVSVTEMDCM